MLSKQRAVTAVHTRRLGDFLRRGCTPSFVSSRFSREFTRAQETYAFLPLRDTFSSIFLRASCTKMQTMRHPDASTSRRRVAGIRCQRNEYYACEKYVGEKNRSSRAEFSKILARKDFHDRASFNACTNAVIWEYCHYFYREIFFYYNRENIS